MYGLLGKKLGHSFSKEIHETFTNKQYSIIEKEEIEPFMREKDFIGLNVTIPYKKDVIPFLNELSEDASSIGVVNTVVNRDGHLKGYNTDIYGLIKSLEYNKVSVAGKEVIILGNGSTSITIEYLCKIKRAKKVTVLARNPKINQYKFSDLYKFSSSTVLFNATPVGMYPNNIHSLALDLDLLPNLEFVMDMIYNPLRSNLLVEAKKRNVLTINGLLMLIFQAIKAIELFHDYKIKDYEVYKYYNDLLFKTSNLVFIGMPMSGKSFFTKKVGSLYNKEVIDIDIEIERNTGISIPNIFEKYGETHFRKLEYDEVVKFSKVRNKAISCGGGVIKNQLNIDYLKQNGVIIFIDFPLAELLKCNSKGRPLLKQSNTLEKLYNQRYNLYKDNADIIIYKTSYNEVETMRQIEVKINEYFNS